MVSVASAELYDPATKTFTRTGEMTMARRGHAATLLPRGRVLITGVYAGGYTAGIATDPTPISAELYDPPTGIFTPAGNMAGPGGGATLLASGKVLITPRIFDGRPIEDEIYDPSTGTFSSTVNRSDCCESTATLLMNGNVLVAYGAAYGVQEIAELYDPASGIFTATENTTAYGTVTRLRSSPMGTSYSLVGAIVFQKFPPFLSPAPRSMIPRKEPSAVPEACRRADGITRPPCSAMAGS